MANLAQMVNVIAPIMTNEDGYFLQPTYFPLVEFTKQAGNTALDVFSESPLYRPANNRPELGYLDVSVTYDTDARELFINVLNRSVDRDLTTRIESQSGALGSAAAVWQMNHDDLKATHAFGNDDVVRPVTRSETLDVTDNGFRYTFPAHSLTILRVPLR
jgi:alpha-N-arabinofuranosidase